MAGHTETRRSSDGSQSVSEDKQGTQYVERVHSKDTEHGTAGYVEKDRLRVDNDDQGMSI
jgi:hypothetical protein